MKAKSARTVGENSQGLASDESPVDFSEFSANTKKLGLTLAGNFH